jgi:hypothetical protein
MTADDLKTLTDLAEELARCGATVARGLGAQSVDVGALEERLGGVLGCAQLAQSRLGLDLGRIMEQARGRAGV